MAIDMGEFSLTSSSGTNLTVSKNNDPWMNVNNNGIITRPKIPYMKAKLSGQGAFYRANPVTFGVVIANVGNCWNNSTGNFTCPRSGYYLVGMSGIVAGTSNASPGYGYCYIKKNGSTYHFTHWNHASYWEYLNLSGIVSCSSGDTISFEIHPSYGYFYGGDDHGNFFITLLR